MIFTIPRKKCVCLGGGTEQIKWWIGEFDLQ